MRSLSSRLNLYVRRFPSFSLVSSLRHHKPGNQDPFGDNELSPEGKGYDDGCSLSEAYGADEPDRSCEGSLHEGESMEKDAQDGVWSVQEHIWRVGTSVSVDAEIQGQGWVSTSVSLEAGVDAAPSSDVSTPASSSDVPPRTLPVASCVAQPSDTNAVKKAKRKRSIEVKDGGKEKAKTGQQVKKDKKWLGEGKGKRQVKRQKNAERRKMVSTASPSANDPLPPHTNQSNPGRPRTSTSEKYSQPSVLKLDDPAIDEEKANIRNYSTGPGWICDAKKGKGEETKVPTLEEMKARGFQVVSFPPAERLVGLDKDEKITVALTGFPNDASWPKTVSNCGKVMGKAGDISGVPPTHGSRGHISVLHAGCTHYMGTQKPSNRSLGNSSYQEAVTLLRNDSDIKRVAAHQSALLGFYAPKEALYYDVTLDKLYQHDRTLRRPFEKSIYPSVAFNVDRNTVTLDHTDAGNYPVNLCAITAFGNYDHKRGGHIILYDLRLVVEFPVGYTFLIPSGAMRHGNTAISEGETRYSMVQYCPGGLLRWVEHGFQNEAAYERNGGQKLGRDDRWEQVLSKLSRLSELVKDHQLYRRGH